MFTILSARFSVRLVYTLQSHLKTVFFVKIKVLFNIFASTASILRASNEAISKKIFSHSYLNWFSNANIYLYTIVRNIDYGTCKRLVIFQLSMHLNLNVIFTVPKLILSKENLLTQNVSSSILSSPIKILLQVKHSKFCLSCWSTHNLYNIWVPSVFFFATIKHLLDFIAYNIQYTTHTQPFGVLNI